MLPTSHTPFAKIFANLLPTFWQPLQTFTNLLPISCKPRGFTENHRRGPRRPPKTLCLGSGFETPNPEPPTSNRQPPTADRAAPTAIHDRPLFPRARNMNSPRLSRDRPETVSKLSCSFLGIQEAKRRPLRPNDKLSHNLLVKQKGFDTPKSLDWHRFSTSLFAVFFVYVFRFSLFYFSCFSFGFSGLFVCFLYSFFCFSTI